VEINLASRLMQGAITAYQEATTLYMVPVTLIGVAISTAAFPKMTERIAHGETQLFKKELQTILRVIIWLALPAVVVTFLTRGYLVSFLEPKGDQTMADILGVLAVGILFRSIYQIASRSFYAQQDTRTPLYISFFTIGLNIALAVWFVATLGFGVFGLAAAQAAVALVEVMILFSIMSTRIRGIFDLDFLHGVVKMITAAGLMFIVTYVTVSIFSLRVTDTSLFISVPRFGLVAAAGLTSYLLFSWMLGLKEATPILKLLRKVMLGNLGAPEEGYGPTKDS
ncbi:MAG TPA: lipid II flippase MurJ, partial [Candidatus Acidoferrum sp.]|nr:lipid II flippase MurJ [Candidatus Acidoferrum sp.]